MTLFQADAARAQSACTFDATALLLSLPGGGAFVPLLGTPVTVAPETLTSLGVHCETSGQFPPPVIADARYQWSSGETSQRIEVMAPAPGQIASYTVVVSASGGTRTLGATLMGAPQGVPICRVVSDVAQPVALGTTFQVAADCSPQATSFRWDAPTFLGTISIVGPTEGPVTRVRLDDGQPGAVFPVYLTASNFVGAAPYASLLVTVGLRGAAPTNAPALALGGAHSCALTSAGGSRCWGDDQRGQLGDFAGAVLYSTTPVNGIGLSTGLRQLASGLDHVCALAASGGVKCWGRNDVGQLGDGTLTRALRQVEVVGIGDAIAIGAGATSHHACAIRAGGGTWCWGLNQDGQLGNGNNANQAAAVAATAAPPAVRMVATGQAHTCVLTSANAVFCWGRNTEGQLGDGTTQSRASAVAVRGLSSGVSAITAGHSHTCALLQSGAVHCWGRNDSGQLGSGATQPRSLEPVPVAALSDRIAKVAAGESHTCAVTAGGAALCWGANAQGQLGDGTLSARRAPVPVRALSANARDVSAGVAHTCATFEGGGVLCWGSNGSGRIGDATSANRATPQLVVGTRGEGFLDLTLEDGFAPPADRVPIFPAVTSGSFTDITAQIRFREQDVGRPGSVYVFALAPAPLVRGVALESTPALGKAVRDDGARADEVQCVLAQLNGSGQLQQVSAQNLQAFVTGVLGGQGEAVRIINGVPTANIAGATFFVGYGPTGTAMLDGGTNRSVVSVPGSLRCQPQAPQTGWWWNPAEGGRGYSMEVQGNNIFFAAFHYDASGRPAWHVATGPTSLDGSLYQGPLLRAEGGQTLAGPYPGMPRLASEGPITLAFSDASHGTMVWPGGAVAIERFDIVPGGLAAPPRAGQPENGWWWNPEESGRGFFIEWQDGTADLAGYMYDDAGQPVWYLSVYATPSPARFEGNWWSYANGQAMGAAYRPATRVDDNVAPVTVQFTAPDRAVMTLPGGRQLPLVRHRF